MYVYNMFIKYLYNMFIKYLYNMFIKYLYNMFIKYLYNTCMYINCVYITVKLVESYMHISNWYEKCFNSI